MPRIKKSCLSKSIAMIALSAFSVFGSVATHAETFSNDAVLVKFKPGLAGEEKAHVRAAVHGKIERKYKIVPGLEKIKIPPGQVEKALARLSKNPNIVYAEPDFIIEPLSITPNDTYFNDLHGMQRISAPLAWQTSTGDTQQIIAVVDSGIDYTHPDLAQNMWVNNGEIPNDGIDNDNNGYVDDVYGYDFVNNDGDPMDDNSHGTHVSGTICGQGNNNEGVTGVLWRCQLMALKFLGADNRGSYSDAIGALDYAVSMGAKISNHSWGGDSFSNSLFDALASADRAGHLVISSAGNDGRSTDITPAYPAAYDLDNIISVANIDTDDSLRYDSNWGAVSVDLGAPGSSIYSTMPNGYGYKWGTSMAAPHVTGVAGLYSVLNPQASAGDIKQAILSSVSALPALDGKSVSGGMLNAAATLGVMPSSDGSLSLNIMSGIDDVEESKASGSVYLDSSDLEFGYDSYVSSRQWVGLRFRNVQIPAGATITSAELRLISDEAGSDAAALTIQVQDTLNAPVFDSQNFNVSHRARMESAVNWSLPAWQASGEVHVSPDLSGLIQPLIDKEGWMPGNALALIIDSTGTRTAYAWEGSSGLSAQLNVNYTGVPSDPVATPNQAPVASFTASVIEGQVPFDVSFTDASSDSDGHIVDWLWAFGDGSTSSEQNPVHQYIESGSYTVVLNVTDNDGSVATMSQIITATSADVSPNAPDSLNINKTFTGKGKSRTLSSLTLTWQDNSSNESGFVVERCEEMTSGKGKRQTTVCDFSTLMSLDADITEAALEPVTGFQYRVKAVNDFGASGWSNTVSY